ncbi:MAG: D-alanyl-D-alanine carboxypeptidase family protein [Sulfobacillus sp.]
MTVVGDTRTAPREAIFTRTLFRWLIALVLLGTAASLVVGRVAKVPVKATPVPVAALPGKSTSAPLPSFPTPRYALSLGGATLAAAVAQTPWPLASLTKIMTAMVVLNSANYPLGRTITITAAEQLQSRQELAQGDSVMQVLAGQQYSVAQLLYAMMLPSADNAASILASMYPGGQNAFVAQMNTQARAWGLTHLSYQDPSGLSPTDLGSPQDLLRLTQRALANPTFAQIVRTKQIFIPDLGTVTNLNQLLSRVPGTLGVKTGWTPQSGRNLDWAIRTSLPGHPMLVGIYLDGPGGFGPIFSSIQQLVSYVNQHYTTTVLAAGTVVAVAHLPFGFSVPLRLAHPLLLVGAKGTPVHVTWAPTAGGQGLPGRITLTVGTEAYTPALLPPAFPFLYRLAVFF